MLRYFKYNEIIDVHYNKLSIDFRVHSIYCSLTETTQKDSVTGLTKFDNCWMCVYRCGMRSYTYLILSIFCDVYKLSAEQQEKNHIHFQIWTATAVKRDLLSYIFLLTCLFRYLISFSEK